VIALSRNALTAVVLLGGLTTAWAEGSRLTIQVEAGRVHADLRGEQAVVVYQGDDRTNVRVRGSRRESRSSVQRVDLRAESVVAFVDGVGAPTRGDGLPVQGLYAQGFVHVEITTAKTGRTVIEGEEIYLDFVNERAYVREAQLWVKPMGGGTTGPADSLLSASFMIRARYLRALGSDRLEAEDAWATVCDFGDPHFALGGRKLIVRSSGTRPAPPSAAAGALGSVAGAVAARAARPRLLANLGRKRPTSKRSGSDALKRLSREPRRIEVEGIQADVLGKTVPLFPWFTWGTDWPVPSLSVGKSNRFGTFARVGLRHQVASFGADGDETLVLTGEEQVDYYETRGTAADLSLEWQHNDRSGTNRGEGFVRAFAIDDRGDEDRVGTAIRNEGRFWVRGLLRETLAPSVDAKRLTPRFNLNLDAEFSRISDPGVLLEYHRSVAKRDKEQESYVNLRSSLDDIGVRVLSRHRINGWQDQVERLPEARLDWILAPIFTDPDFGGLYLDLASRGGNLRRKPSYDGASYRAYRGDFKVELNYKNTLGPLQVRGYGSARETVWSERAGSPDSIDRFAGGAGWNLTLPLWRRYTTPWGAMRHAILPEIGTRHRYHVNRDPGELLQFDEVETLAPTDHAFLRIRTRLITDVARRRRKLLDLSVETRYFLEDRATEVRDTWASILFDLRVDVGFANLRARYEHDIENDALLKLAVDLTITPIDELSVITSYQEIAGTKPFAWTLRWRPVKSWAFGVSQQYDFGPADEFLRHRGNVVRYFHRFALEAAISHDPQQDDTSISVNLAPLWDDSDDPFFDPAARWDLF
jgi:hypothetical protein